MNVNKKLIIVALILLSLFMIGTASATSDTDVVNSDVTQKVSHKDVAKKNTDTISKKKNVNTKEDNSKTSSTKNKDILRADEKTFSELNKNISDAGNNPTTITLQHDYIQDTDSEITIEDNQKITINGNGHTLDAKEKSRIFIVNGELILKNLNLINGKTTDEGGAIYWYGDNGRVENCNFTNNTARYGGAIYWGIKFETPGGEINQEIAKNGSIINSNFNNNYGEMGNGGAIYWFANNGSITNSNFNDNHLTNNGGEGGAIYWNGHNGTINSCDFINNEAENVGGAISWKSENSTITNCNFINNIAQNKQGQINLGGGAIYCFASNARITNCYFSNNKDYSKPFFLAGYSGGGAIYLSKSDNYVSACIFVNNSAEKHGGAIWCNGGTITDCIFLDNKDGFNNEAIYDSSSSLKVDYNWFGNTASNYNETALVGGTDTCDNWLFLNGTANPDPIQLLSSSNITFELYLYNSSSKNVSRYDYSHLKPVNLTIDYNPNIDKSFALLGEKIHYTTSSPGSDSVTARISNVEYSIKLEITQIPTNITIDTDSITLNVTDTAQIHAKLKPSSAGSLNYTSNDTSVVTVDKYGNITAVGQGIANITISFAGQGDYAAAENKTILVTVNLKDASVSVNNDTLDLFIDDEFTIIAFTEPKSLNVTYILDNSGVVSIDEDGKITALKKGKTQIIIKINGEGVYFENSTTINVTVSKIPTTINIENNKITLNATENITTGAILDPNDAGSLKYTSNDTSVAIVRDGKIIAIRAGVANITVSFAGNEKYAGADNKTILVTVKLKEINTQITGLTIPNDLFEGKTSNISGTLTANNTGFANQKITISITNNKGYKEIFIGKTDNNGKFNIKIKPGVSGPVTITTTYNGHKTNKYNYKQASNSANRNVQKVVYNIKLDTLQSSYDYNTKVNITGKITSNYKPLDVKNVNITINGVRKTVALNNKGEFKYASPYTTAGLYKVLLNCSGTIKNTQYFIKYPTKFTISKIPNIKQGSKIQLTITEKNKYTGPVKVTIGSETYAVKLNKGTGKKTVTPKLAPGKYVAKIRFTGDKKYSPTNAVSNKFQVTPKPVVKLATKIIAVKKTFYVEDTTKKYNISLKDANGKIVKNAIVTLKVKGKTYKTKTNNKGVATFDLNNLDQKGQYNSLIKYAGNKNYKPSNKKVKITVKIRFTTVSKGSKDKNTVKKIQKALKKNGYYLYAGKHYLKIDGIFYVWTEKEVKRYQKNNKLPVTGKVDYYTASKLGII